MAGKEYADGVRNLFDRESGALRDKRHLIVDRDAKYSINFRQAIARKGVEVIRLPPRSSNLNAYAERFVRSIKDECVFKIIPIGPSMLRRWLHEFAEHYHRERNHQGLSNRLIQGSPIRGRVTERIQCRSRLGGALRYYERIHTIYGWHVVKLLETRAADPPPFEQVRAQIADNLVQERYQAFLAQSLKAVASN